MSSRVVVVIPTYNESGNIVKLILQILHFQPEFDILVIDDNSPDSTGTVVEALSIKYDNIKILRQSEKSGLGRAYLEGFKWVLTQRASYERIIQMDADFSHQPEYLGNLLSATENRDISLGSRYIRGGKVFQWGLRRRLLSYIANFYVRFWLGLKVKDSTSGFRCFRREVLSNAGLETIKSNGYLFQIELLTRCLRLGYSVKEIPITFVNRKEGKTKLGFSEIWEAVWGVPKLAFFSN